METWRFVGKKFVIDFCIGYLSFSDQSDSLFKLSLGIANNQDVFLVTIHVDHMHRMRSYFYMLNKL